MSINQDFISRSIVDTIANATTTNVRVGETVNISETGLSYQCNSTGGDITLTNGLFLKSVDHVLRGQSAYPSYVAGKAYAIGDKIYHVSNGLYYRCISPVSTSDPFNLTFWQEFSLESGFALMDAATATTVAHKAEFSTTTSVIGSLFGLSDGAQLTAGQANEIVGGLALDASFNEVNGRAIPDYYFDNSRYGMSHAGVDSPTINSDMAEIIIPQTFVHTGQSITVLKRQLGSAGKVYVYLGDPTSGGTELQPSIGRGESGSDYSYVSYTVPSSDADVRILFFNTLIVDLHVEDLHPEVGTPSHMSEGIRGIGLLSGYTHGDTIEGGDADALAVALGVNASFRTTNGRVLPQYADSWGLGLIGGTHADPTTDGAVIELVFPKESLDPNMEIIIHRSGVGSGNQFVRAYSGDPLSGGVEITPRVGNSIHSTTDSAVVTFVVGSGNIEVPNDIHVVSVGQYVKEVKVDTFLPTASFDTTPIDAIRGGSAYADYQETGTTYAVGDKVTINNLNYQAINSIVSPAGVFDSNDWRELSVEALAEQGVDAQVDALRGSAKYDDYATTGVSYAIGDRVFEPIASKNWRATESILAPAGAFDSTKWEELSLEATAEQLTTSLVDISDQIIAIRGNADYIEYDENANYVIGNKVDVGASSFICIIDTPVPAGIFIPANWRELSVERLDEEVAVSTQSHEALRGGANYSNYQESGISYDAGDKVFFNGLNYEALADIPAPTGIFDPNEWKELSIEANADAIEINSTAIQTLVSGGAGTFQDVASNIVTRDSIVSGTRLTKAQADELLQRTLGVDASYRDTSSRTMPLISASNDSWFIWDNTSVDETIPSACNEIIIPADSVRGKALTANYTRSTSSGTRMFRVYNGDPTNNGTLIEPTFGNSSNITGTVSTVVWDLERGQGGINDIHIVVQRQGVWDLQLVDNAPFKALNIQTSKFGQAALAVFQEIGSGNGTSLGTWADDMIKGLGVGATFRADAGRQYPVMFGNGAGFFASFVPDDETQPTGDVCEIVIPQSNLAHNQILEVKFGQVTTGGADRDVRVYAGNPTGGGTRLTPVLGVETHGATDTTYWNVSTAPESGTSVTADLHIVFRRVTVVDIAIHTNLPLGDTSGALERLELRGGIRPAEFSQTSTYSVGDKVYVAANNRQYTAQEAVAAGVFNASQWNETSVNNNEANIGRLTTAVEALRGQTNVPLFSSTATYAEDDIVEESTLLYRAKSAITAGAFNASQWQLVSVIENESRIQTLDDENITQNDELERLRGADVYPDYDPANSNPYAVGDIVHDSTGTGKYYRAKVIVPANYGTFDETQTGVWDIVSVTGNNAPANIARRLEELTGTDRLSTDGIDFLDRFQTVYVSQTGDNTNDGRTFESPVQTLDRANTIAQTLPALVNRVIICLDGSEFNGDFTAPEDTHIYMPWAALLGNFTSGNLSQDVYTFSSITGDVTMGKDDILNVSEFVGDLTISNSSTTDCVLNVDRQMSGNITIPAGAVGKVRLNISSVGTGTLTDNSGGAVSLRGWYDERLLGVAVDLEGTQIVYVSNSGDDTFNGRSVEQSVATIAQAITLSSALPLTGKRVIQCLDASSFTANIALTTPIDFAMPFATITGNVSNTIAARCEYTFGAVVGNVTITNGSHYRVGQLMGDLTIGDGTLASPFIHIEDYNSGTFSDTGAQGDVEMYIIHDSVGVTPTPAAGYVPYGRVGVTDLEPASAVKSKLETLIGDDRLDASAIKNLAVGGSGHTITPYTGFASAGNGWYDLVVFDRVASGARGTHNVDLIMELLAEGADNSSVRNLVASVVFGTTLTESAVTIGLRNDINNGSTADTGTVYRLIQDTNDNEDVIRLQMEIDSGRTYEGYVANHLPEAYGADVTFAPLSLYTATGNEVVLDTLDTTDWNTRNVTEGISGGMACDSVGEHATGQQAYIDFADGVVDIHAGDTTVVKASAVGTRMSAGEYGTWITPTSTDWPIDAIDWTNLINEKRLTVDDTTKNPSSTITWSAVDIGGTNAAAMTGYDGAHRGLRFTTTSGTRGLAMTFANCLYQRLSLSFTFGVATTAGGATQDYELIDSTGTVLATFQTPTNSNAGDTYTFAYDLETESGDTEVTLRKASTGTSQAVYLFNYSMAVNVDEPALEPLVVVQQDSPLRGTLLPRIIPQNSGHPQGSMALDGLAQNRPIWHDGSEWNYLNTTRIDFSPVSAGQFFFAEGQTFNDSSWTGSNHVRLVPTQNYQGFPETIRCTQSGGTITIQAPNNTQAFWDVARANGFRVDYRMYFSATHDGQIWMDIEPNNTSWGSNGRFEASVQVNSGQLQVVMINAGGNTTFDLERDAMHTISMVCAPNSDIAEIHVEGVKVGEVTYSGGGTTDRGTFFYIPPGNAVNDFAIQSITTYAMSAADRDVTLDRTAIQTGLRYNVPNISSPTNLRVPKGLYDIGNTFTVVNGSTEVSTVSGLADDHQLFGGVSEYEVLPQKEVTFTQTGFPKGNVWSVEGGKTVINHSDNVSTGNSLILTVSSAGAVLGRHGSYLGDLTVTRPSTGEFLITAGTKIWGDELSIIATPTGTTAKEITAGTGGLGAAYVNTYDAAGNALSDAFYCALYW